MEELIATLIQMLEYEPTMVTALVTAIGALFAHALVTMAVAVKEGVFCWAEVSDFLRADVAPYLIALVGMGIGGLVSPVLLALYYAAAAGIVASMLDKIQTKWTEGLSMPLETD